MSLSQPVADEPAIMPASFGVAREGYPFIGIALVIATLAFLILGKGVGFVSLILPIFVINFFRDPERVVPAGEGLVISPADGKVISVGEVEEQRYLNQRLKRICIFMSVVNVHVNRIPISGRVRDVRYNPGKFLIGFAEKASLDNEQNAMVIEREDGKKVLFVQIAGFVARRIVCYLKGGERVRQGERFGLIRFGSRVDVYLPTDAQISVKVGEVTKAGETILGRLS